MAMTIGSDCIGSAVTHRASTFFLGLDGPITWLAAGISAVDRGIPLSTGEIADSYPLVVGCPGTDTS
jgi:hypothetical protein